MVGRKRSLRPRGSASANVARVPKPPASIYDQMLEEAGVGELQSSTATERPSKRLKPGQKPQPQLSLAPEAAPLATATAAVHNGSSTDSEDDLEFLDVPLPTTQQQVIEIASEDESDEDDVEFENVLNLIEPLQSTPSAQPSELELNLSAQKELLAPPKNAADRRKPISKEERERRLQIHEMHLLCLLSHVARRNHWCNDATVQASLRKHLNNKTITYLTPGSHLPQFGQAESLKNGLKQAAEFWKVNYEITERGMKRALWAEEPDQLEQYVIPEDLDSCLDREAFRDAAEHLQGSRDVGAQLYCAMLRSVGVQARLVCSLQPLAFGSGAPTLPKPAPSITSTKAKKTEAVLAQIAKQREAVASENRPPPGTAASLRRLGHPNAASYNFEPTASPPKNKHLHTPPRRIKESAYPIYWVEVLDKGHQKWQPADPVVTNTFWKPKSLEPPITDKDNSLAYVVAFDANGSAKDVTIRYAKAYAAKTRRMRVDGVEGQGSTWWQRVMSLYRRGMPSNLDQIESNELAGLELREPMPRNVQDFKDHPVFALERHLRRHEVLIPSANPSGTVSAGTKGPLEKIYRRRDVRTAKTVDKWFRCGREVKPNEIPAKWLPKKIKRKANRLEDDDPDDTEDLQGGVPIYTEEQTELYEPRPVRNGIVPKNKFGNIEIYVSSMVPRGGAHISHEHARRAAFLAGVDHAPALTGFQFKGRQGTAVFDGVVVPLENEEAVRAIIEGIADLEILMEEERRTLAALKVWRRFMMGLRIRERIWSGVDAEEREAADNEALDAEAIAALETDRQAALEAHEQAALDAEMQDAASDVTEEFDMVADDDSDMGGGFLIE